MRYSMKQKWLAFGDDFVVNDEEGNRAYYIDGKVLTIRDTFVMTDASGNEAAVIRKRLLAWGPTYEILRGGEVVGVVKKKVFTLMHCKFEVDVPGAGGAGGAGDLEAKGDFLDHEYSFERGGRAVAHVSKRWLALTDSYGIDVGEGEDDALIIAAAAVIDACCHPDAKH